MARKLYLATYRLSPVIRNNNNKKKKITETLKRLRSNFFADDEALFSYITEICNC